MHFDPADGSKPTQATVRTGTLASPPQKNPQREGFRFDGWTLDGQPFDFQTPILQDTTLTARWTKATDWTLSPDHGPSSGTQLTVSPPDKKKPYYTSIHTANSQFVGLTGDGNIYIWTQDGTPKQVPLPAQAPDGFHYLQAAAGSQWQTALGSDQHIYTWTSQQPMPTILDTDLNIRFTSISTSSNRLLAVDQQGRVHNFQASQADSRNMKPTEQSTISLPGQTQAILAVASPSRTLIVDADGQAWAWKPGQAGNTKPSPIMQAAALNQGLLLLDADGLTRYLADSTTSAKAVNLPESTKANRISASNDQAIITDKDGHLWLWKPGEAPMRADSGNQHYMQAVRIGNESAALDRQGSLYQWSIDAQGLPGKPAKIDSTTAPTLESASLDGQALPLSKTGDVWQADVPARDPGPAVITITGRQDDKPFTKSLNYTVDQPLLRDAQQDSTHTITFDTAGGSQAPQPQQVGYPYGRVKRPSPDPTRNGYQFYGWFIDNVAYDFSKPVTKDLRLTAHWSSNKWTISPDTGSQIGGERTTITPPTNTNGIKFNQISSSNTGSFSLAVGSDGNAYAWGDNTYGQLGDGTAKNSRYTPVMVQKPDRKTYPDLPTNFTYVQVSAGGRHSIALGSDGYAYAWGYNSSGQLGNNTKTDSHVPVRVRDPGSPTDESRGLKAIQVSAGYWHSLALGSDGYVYAWGYNWYGQLGNNTKTDSYVPVPVRDPANPTDTSKGLKATQISAGYWHSLAVGSDGYVYAWGNNGNGRLGDGTTNGKLVPVSVMFNPQPVIAAAKFDTSPGTHLTPVSNSNSNSVTVLTPAHLPGTVTVSVEYTMGGAGNTLTDTSLRYTYTPAGVLPQAGGEGILLALATGMTGMGGVLASRRHRRETRQLSQASHE
uniref:RCC1 domain-containing protein n=1 Tax=Bifidobacterium mizhiense TaxID=2879940 RepID=UPI001E4DBD29|nr:InlB B-repeat-containing protein [Bifidobacterium mizhiense]